MLCIPMLKANIPELRGFLTEASNADVYETHEPRRHNLDKAARALKLQNICVVKSQRLHRAPPLHFDLVVRILALSWSNCIIFFYLGYAPDPPVPCQWVTENTLPHVEGTPRCKKLCRVGVPEDERLTLRLCVKPTGLPGRVSTR